MPPGAFPIAPQAVAQADLAGSLSRLEMAAQLAAGRGHPPVETWNPPCCGDIGMAIARDGIWHYRGSPIRRPELVRLFASVMLRAPDGRFYLVTPAEKVDVAVEDAPFLGVEIEVLGEGRDQVLVLRTNLDEVVRVGADHPLRFEQVPDGGLKPYVRVRGRLEALLTRAVTYELADLMMSEVGENVGVWSGGCFFPFRSSSVGASGSQHPQLSE